MTTIEETLPETGVYTLVVDEGSRDAVNFGLDVQCLFGPCAGPVPIASHCWISTLTGSFDALNDGLLIIRYAFGFAGQTLIDGAVTRPIASAARPSEIEARLAYVGSLWE